MTPRLTALKATSHRGLAWEGFFWMWRSDLLGLPNAALKDVAVE
jgi:hypothetical protein